VKRLARFDDRRRRDLDITLRSRSVGWGRWRSGMIELLGDDGARREKARSGMRKPARDCRGTPFSGRLQEPTPFSWLGTSSPQEDRTCALY
jgi:hypothetical protein